ncbi:unnamed protein product [Arabidopsis halleri]
MRVFCCNLYQKYLINGIIVNFRFLAFIQLYFMDQILANNENIADKK